MNNSTSLSYTVCTHDWSFLEGDKKHSHTLKEGRHVFPFQLRIGGSLPSSISMLESGGASVSYRLRAQATRPGFNHNLQVTVPVHIIRSLSQEALEYQQTLEIENTWPEKLMYSIMLPHKAWAAGDTLVALVKFSPLSKGTSIVRVASSLHETVSIYGRSGSQGHVRMMTSVTHAIVNGRAVLSDGEPTAVSQPGRSGPTSRLGGSCTQEGSNGSSETLRDNNDVVTTLTMPLPSTITPTHGVEPIVTSHRVRWSILIGNPDGHTSELRCSLPVRILDSRLLQEAKRHTASTRRLLLGGPEISISEGDDEMELPSYSSHVRDRVAGVALPDIGSVGFSYTSTTSDGGTPLTPDANVVLSGGIRSGYSTPLEPSEFGHLPHIPTSGDNTSLEWITSELLSQQQQHQQRRSGTRCRTSYYVPDEHTDSDVSRPASRAPSRPASSHSSRAASRSASPEFQGTSGASSSGPRHGLASSDSNGDPDALHPRDGHGSRNLHGLLRATITSITHSHWLTRSSAPHGNLVDLPSHQTGARLKPIRPQPLAFPPPGDPTSNEQSSQHQQQLRVSSLVTQPSSAVSPPSTADSAFFLPRLLTEVPDYDAASRGFMGGLPPLTSLQGLPSYEEAAMSAPSTPPGGNSAQSEGGLCMGGAQGRLTQAQRARSESDLISRMAGMGLEPLENARQS